MLIGLAVAVQWPLFLYQGGLVGLQRQVALGAINTVMQAVRFAGVIPLMIVWPSLELFFAYQAAAGLVHAAVAGVWLWRCMPASPGAGRAAFRWENLRALRYFAAGMSGIAVSSLIISQLDKMLLSGLALEAFGYYTIAAQAAGGLSRVFGPVLPATLPRFAELIARDQWAELSALYHRCAQFLSVMLVPLAALLAVWAGPVLAVWTGRPDVALHAALVLTLLTISAALNGLLTLAYSLQLAFGWTKLTLWSGLVAMAVTIPTMIVATRFYGAAGAAAAAILPNAIQLLIGVTMMHRRILRGELRRWVLVDVGGPLLAGGAVVAIAAAVIPFGGSVLDTLVKLIAVALACLLACVVAAPQIRAIAVDHVLTGRRKRPVA
jgi:O-antigen/teichoic acid export membrane protein